MMDHRCGRRLSIDIPVRLRFGDGVCGVGRAFNISSGGMFIRTSARPRRNRCIDVRLLLSTPTGERPFLIPAMVVHAGNGGLGLMFRDLDARAVEALSMMMRRNGDDALLPSRREDAAA